MICIIDIYNEAAADDQLRCVTPLCAGAMQRFPRGSGRSTGRLGPRGVKLKRFERRADLPWARLNPGVETLRHVLDECRAISSGQRHRIYSGLF